jgi:hypothetical protein
MKILSSIDILGNEPQTFIFSKTRYKTNFGGIISILTIGAILTLTLYFLVLFFTRKQMNLISSQTTTFNRTLDLSSIPLLFVPSTNNGVQYNSTVMYPVIQLWNYYPEAHGTVNITNIPYKHCEESDIAGYEPLFVGFNISNYYCLDKKGVNLTLFGMNGDVGNGYSKLQFYIAKCTNGSSLNPNVNKNSCMSSSQIDTVLSGTPLHLYLTYPDTNINHENVTEPSFSYLKTEDFNFPLLAMVRYSYIFKNTYIHSDFGYVFDDNEQKMSFQYDSSTSFMLLGSTFNIKEAYGLLSFQLSQKADIHVRSYTKLQSLLANIGGVVNFVYLVAKILVRYVTQKMLDLDFVNNRLTDKQFKEVMKSSTNLSTVKVFNLQSEGIFQHGKPDVAIHSQNKALEETITAKLKKLSVSYKHFFCPIVYLRNSNEVYKRINYYLKAKLSLDNIVKDLDDLDKLKMYIFNNPELYLLENMDRFKSTFLSFKQREPFDAEKFKHSYKDVVSNQKLIQLMKDS